MKRPLDAGQLRHRVTIERPDGTADGAGGETPGWEAVATVWAAVDPVSAREAAVAGHAAGVVTHRIAIRWRDDVTGAMRVLHRGRTLRVVAVHDPDETGRWLVLSAIEEAA